MVMLPTQCPNCVGVRSLFAACFDCIAELKAVSINGGGYASWTPLFLFLRWDVGKGILYGLEHIYAITMYIYIYPIFYSVYGWLREYQTDGHNVKHCFNSSYGIARDVVVSQCLSIVYFLLVYPLEKSTIGLWKGKLLLLLLVSSFTLTVCLTQSVNRERESVNV